jgi:hypothetical protein
MSSVSDAASSTVPGTSRAFEDVALAVEVAQQDGDGNVRFLLPNKVVSH